MTELEQAREALAHWENWASKQFLVLPESREGQHLESLRATVKRLEQAVTANQPTPPRPAVPEPTQAVVQLRRYIGDRGKHHSRCGTHDNRGCNCYARPHENAHEALDRLEAVLAASREENAELRKLLEARKGEYE